MELFEHYAQTHPMDGTVPHLLRHVLRQIVGSGWIVDLGCGDGRILREIASLRSEVIGPESGARLVGLEISHERARRVQSQGFLVVRAEAEKLPFRPESAAAVLMIEVIEHLADPGQVLEEVTRVLQPEGLLVLSTPNYPIKRVYDILAYLRGTRPSWRDDPTHFSPMSFRRLGRLLRKFFGSVDLWPTYVAGELRLRALQRVRDGRHPLAYPLSHKLVALCRHPVRRRS
jgi:2-polyprenyl-3-methyl-5-hydroxy-6-metoxy-1,4-benzoquinol methylase